MGTDYPPTPSQEARIQALERLTTTLNARIEQLSNDMARSFRQQVTYEEQRFNQLENKIDSMKTEILDAFTQLLTIIKTRLPEPPAQ
jgi:outer membrane murein-binding lipoprotein Lpp